MAPGSCWCLQHVLAAPLMFYPPLLQGCDGNRPPGVHAAFPPPDWQALGAPNCTSAVGSTVREPCKHVLELQACSVPLPHCHPFSLSLVCDFRKALATPRLAVKAFCYMCSLFQHVSCRQEFLLSGPQHGWCLWAVGGRLFPPPVRGTCWQLCAAMQCRSRRGGGPRGSRVLYQHS